MEQSRINFSFFGTLEVFNQKKTSIKNGEITLKGLITIKCHIGTLSAQNTKYADAG